MPHQQSKLCYGGLYKIRDCVYFLCSAVSSASSTSSFSFCLLTGTFRACAFLKDIKIVWHNWHNSNNKKKEKEKKGKKEKKQPSICRFCFLFCLVFSAHTFFVDSYLPTKRQVIYLTGRDSNNNNNNNEERLHNRHNNFS